MAPPTAVPAPATVVSTAFQKGSRRPMVVAVRVLVVLRGGGLRKVRDVYVMWFGGFKVLVEVL